MSQQASGGGRCCSGCGVSYATLVAFASSIAGLCFGYEIGIIASVLEMDSFQLWAGTGVRDGSGVVVPSDAEATLNGAVVSSFLFGCMFGSVLVYFLADMIGRRGSIFVGATLFVVGGVLQASAAALAGLFAGRVIGGAGIGVLSMVAPLYISETAETASRGRLIATQQLLITCGIFAASCVNAALFSLGAGLGDGQWRAALAAQVVPGLALALVMLPLPRSPRWLVSRGRTSEARAVLARLRSLPLDNEAIDAELHGIEAEVAAEFGLDLPQPALAQVSAVAAPPPGIESAPALAAKEPLAPPPLATLSVAAHWRRLLDLGGADVRPQLLLVCLLQFFQQMTGINVVLYYAADLFTRAGVPPDAAATWCVMANAGLLEIGRAHV